MKKGRNPGKFRSFDLSMNQLYVLVLIFPFGFSQIDAQPPLGQGNVLSQDMVSDFRPSLAVVIGILSIMFSLTFILLVYAKLCHRSSAVHANQQNLPVLIRSGSRSSGIDKTVIESLPFFRFSSLRGSKEGLECAVCLSKFEDIEILRLMPKCKHAFHIACVDKWLESHSSCPLCRHKVSAEDLAFITHSNSLRFLWNSSELQEDSNLELFVQREESHHGSSRFSIGSSFRKIEKSMKEEELPIQEEHGGSDDEDELFHRFNHKIIVSDVVFKNRWSSVSSSDLMFLNSEMTNATSSERFSPLDANTEQFTTTRAIDDYQIMKIKEQMERKRLFESKITGINRSNSVSFSGLASTSDSGANKSRTPNILISADKRSKSEITAVSRFTEFGTKNKPGGYFFPENTTEERMRRLWLPIARRTVQWFANRERRPLQSQNTRQSSDV